ncbi:hypothetical protein BS50DRAFT_254408 [Corynespora cassiicola Philippines]|uniref:Uncharacterized protein n=1 Tax=Corynespora cassiicola Philippines TaxID=1448308 RepID=A0A2T2P4E6_CORCC|nr:hypothetical protein BS50DRAFT_254408 [Corynespora cassiicola Philippines]
MLSTDREMQGLAGFSSALAKRSRCLETAAEPGTLPLSLAVGALGALPCDSDTTRPHIRFMKQQRGGHSATQARECAKQETPRRLGAAVRGRMAWLADPISSSGDCLLVGLPTFYRRLVTLSSHLILSFSCAPLKLAFILSVPVHSFFVTLLHC